MVELSLTDVPNPQDGLEGLTDLTCLPNPDRSILVDGSGVFSVIVAAMDVIRSLHRD